MLAYFDSSALVKLYVQEQHAARAEALAEQAQFALVTSVIAYAEVSAAFARYHRDGKLSAEQYQQITSDFQADWAGMNEVEVTPAIYIRAAQLLQAHPRLRAMDALHLASVLWVRERRAIKFLTFDTDLENVARALLDPQELG